MSALNSVSSVRLITDTPFIAQELNDVIRLFLGDVPISEDAGEMQLIHHHEIEGNLRRDMISDGEHEYFRASELTQDELESKRRIKRAAKNALFELLMNKFEYRPPWGSLTGIRPTRLIYEALDRGMSLEAAKSRLVNEFFVSPEKVEILGEILKMQSGIIYPPEDSFDLYIHIPFCVSRCSYCSFATNVVGKGKLTEPYTQSLINELKGSAEIIKQLGLRIRAGYVGGGTPTAISSDQLERILDCAMNLFPNAVEWTVEAGRPDTIDREKLTMLKRLNVERISVNPQSFSDETLKLIGRAHTARDTIAAYRLARDLGFNHINMDLIAALPNEGMSEFNHTLDKTIELSPESVTVHSLAIKRSSKLHERLTVQGDSHNMAHALSADEMVSCAYKRLTDAGYNPYYLYRQKYMAGNLENIGYAKSGYACLYNIGNMEETQRVLAVGAGSISKWLFDGRRRIERAANLRNIEEYIARTDEMTLKKRQMILQEGK